MSILLVVLILTSVTLWVLVTAPHWGSLLAVTGVTSALAVAIVLALLATPFVPVAMGLVVIAVLLAACAAAVVVLARRRRPVSRPSRYSLALWGAASLGAIVWIAVRVSAEFVPGASRVSWAMEGDATNNLNYARRMIADNGILLGAAENPVPIPAAAVALPLSLDHLFGSGNADLAAELSSYGWIWIAGLAVSCVVMGVVAAALIDPRKRALVAVASAAGSLLPLTWFVSGLSIEFGYFNFCFATTLVLASWLAYLGCVRAPGVSLTVLVAIATLSLLTWSPVLLVPTALGLVIAVRHRRALLASRGWALGALIGAVALFVALAGALTIPTFLHQSVGLVSGSQGYPKSWVLLFVVLAVALLAAAHLRKRIELPVFPGLLALIAACYAGVALFLYIARDEFDPWNGYYPIKLLALVGVVMLPIALSLAAAALAGVRARGLALAAVTIAAACTVVLAAWAPATSVPGGVVRQPAERILGGHVWSTGDDAIPTIVALAKRGQTAILWESGSPDEQLINFWLGYSVGEQDTGDRILRRFGFLEYGAFRQNGTRTVTSTNALCELMRDPARSIVIYTRNADLEAQFDEKCTGSTAEYRVGETPGIDN